MNPIIKLIHDDATKIWICGDETGDIVLVSDALAMDAIDSLWSKKLRAVKVGDTVSVLHYPTFPDFGKSWHMVEGVWYDALGEPTYKEYTIPIEKGIIPAGAYSYVIRAGFNRDAQTWAYRDGFTKYVNEIDRQR